MVLISLYNNAYKIKNRNYKALKSAYLRYKHSNTDEKDANYRVYEKALHMAITEGRFIGEIHGPFVYGLENYFNY